MKKLLAVAMLLLASVSSFAQFSPGQLVTAAALNNQFSLYVPIAGGTLTGPLTVPTLNTAYAAITGGTIQGTPISGSTGAFTTVNTSGLATLGSASIGGMLSVTGASTLGGTTVTNFQINGTQNATLPVPAWASYATAYAPAWVNLNGFPATSFNGNNTHGTASAFTASIDTPSTDTVWTNSINTGLAGYARSASTSKGSVGVFGAGMSNANNTQQWGANFVATNFDAASGNDTGQLAFLTVGAEDDVYLNGTGLTGTAIGHKIAAAMSMCPSGGCYGIEIAPGNVAGTVGWSSAIAIDDSPNTTALSVGAMGAGNNVASQPVQFKARNSAGTVTLSKIYADANGNITLAPAASTAIQSGVAVGLNGTTAGTVSLANGTPGGASVTIQNGAAGTAWNFNLPANAGNAGQVLTSQGGGSNSMTWTNAGAALYNTAGTLAAASHMVNGIANLASGSATVTLSGSAAYTSSSSYTCTANDTTAANAVKVGQTSGTSITFTGTGTDTVQFACTGN